MMMNKYIVITGSSKGIGRYLVEVFLKRGFIVFGCSRSKSNLNHKNYHHFLTDVSKEEDVKRMTLGIRKTTKKIDYLKTENYTTDEVKEWNAIANIFAAELLSSETNNVPTKLNTELGIFWKGTFVKDKSDEKKNDVPEKGSVKGNSKIEITKIKSNDKILSLKPNED